MKPACENDNIYTFYLLPNKLAEIIEDIKMDISNISDKELKEKLNPIFEWIKKITKRKDKKNTIIIIEQFPPKLNYYFYDFIKKNKLILGEDIN